MAVFTGPRVRANNVFGTISDSPLTAGATTLNSAGLANLPAVSAAHAVIVIDPLRTGGAPEIVIVSAHTTSATSATVTRGAYGTTARQHSAGVLWVHTTTIDDTIRIVTSATRPSDQYEGQLVYETDTNRVALFGGTDWAYCDAGGRLGYASATADQTGITSVADLTSLSVTVTVPTGRRIKITGEIGVQRSVADGLSRFSIQESSTVLQFRDVFVRGNAEGAVLGHAEVVLAPSAGAHTYKLTLATVTGTGNTSLIASSTNPSFILVEDIGAA